MLEKIREALQDIREARARIACGELIDLEEYKHNVAYYIGRTTSERERIYEAIREA